MQINYANLVCYAVRIIPHGALSRHSSITFLMQSCG